MQFDTSTTHLVASAIPVSRPHLEKTNNGGIRECLKTETKTNKTTMPRPRAPRLERQPAVRVRAISKNRDRTRINRAVRPDKVARANLSRITRAAVSRAEGPAETNQPRLRSKTRNAKGSNQF